MSYQDQIVKLTQRAVMDLVQAVGDMPEEARDWQPAPNSRSALNQLREVAMGPQYLTPLFMENPGDSFANHGAAGVDMTEAKLETFEECRQEAMSGLAILCQSMARVPDDRLEEEVLLPFGGGTTMTLADVMALHYWNATYHLGQVTYIAGLFEQC